MLNADFLTRRLKYYPSFEHLDAFLGQGAGAETVGDAISIDSASMMLIAIYGSTGANIIAGG